MNNRPNVTAGLLAAIAVLLAAHLVIQPTAVGQGAQVAVPDVIRAREFHVVSKDGKVIVRLTATKDDEGTVVTLNAKGQKLVELGVTKNHEGKIRSWNAEGRRLPPIWAEERGL